MKLNSVTTVGSMAVGSGGAAAGFAVGTMIFPGVGSIVGAVVGGIAGGFAGEKWSAKAYKSIEQKLIENRERKALEDKHQTFKELEATCRVSHERYDEALHILGIHNFKATLELVEEAYLQMLEIISNGKYSELKSHHESKNSPQQNIEKEDLLHMGNLAEERQFQYMKKYELIMSAYEDAKEYITHYGSHLPESYEEATVNP